MKKREYVYKFTLKEFLNQKSDGRISAIGIEFYREKGDRWSSAEFRISDCNRTINLDLDFQTEEDLEESIYKLNVIRKSCAKTLKYIKENRELILLKESENETK